jgi:beta-N-acetylhexosaminidase
MLFFRILTVCGLLVCLAVVVYGQLAGNPGTSQIGLQGGVSLETAAGQMIICGLRTAEPAGRDYLEVSNQIAEGIVGGVILYAKNILDAAQVRRLTGALRAIPAPYPLFIAVDQEGGTVQRLHADNGFENFPSQKEVAATMTLAEASVLYRRMADVLKEAGFSMNFAPVVDVDVFSNSPAIGAVRRSFSRLPQKVTAFARRALLAHQAAGVVPVIKHFPGHGSALGDTHWGFVDVSKTWQVVELLPFRELGAEGIAPAVMTAHVLLDRYDPVYPATLSERVITGLLRGELGYGGVVVTDDLQMGAIAFRYGLPETVRRAILAGNDILLFSGAFNPDAAISREVHRLILEAVRDGQIDAARIGASFRRILALKERFLGLGAIGR